MSSESHVLYASGMHRIVSFMLPELNRLIYLFLFFVHSFPTRVSGSCQNQMIVGFIPHSKAAAFADLTLDFFEQSESGWRKQVFTFRQRKQSVSDQARLNGHR